MGSFYDQKNTDYVAINGVRIDRTIFMLLEPSYNGTNDVTDKIKYDSNKRLVERWYKSGQYLRKEGIWQQGEHYISRLPLYQRATENSGESNTDIARRVAEIRSIQKGASPDYTTLRKASYPRIEELVVALWESVIEGNEESAKALQKMREKVKKEYPKPEPEQKTRRKKK